jgi:hypothetical protein
MATNPERAARAAVYRLKAETAERAAESATDEHAIKVFSGLAHNYRNLAILMEKWTDQLWLQHKVPAVSAQPNPHPKRDR